MEKFKIVGKAIIGKNGFFSLEQVAAETGIDRAECLRVLERLRLEGIVVTISGTGKTNLDFPRGRRRLRITYRLAARKGLAARLAPRMREDTAADRMWKVMRYKKVFSRRDLRVLAGASEENAKWFTKELRRQGIIRPSCRGGPGVVWTLVKDLGAKRPHI